MFGAERLVDATSIEQVQQLVAGPGKVRTLGTRHSFNDLADTTGTLISVTSIEPDLVIDPVAKTATVGAGTRYGIVATLLEAQGWALHNMGSLPHISVGGAISTGTHGSGVTNGNLSTAVAALEIVTPSGELRTVKRGDADFNGTVVGLGAFGVIVRVTLDIQPSYQLRQDVYRDLEWETFLGDVEAVMGSAYSVSIFTDWVGDTIGQVWLKSRAEGPVPVDLFGAVRDTVSKPAIVGDIADNLTQQGGIPGPWLDRLPHFRLDSTPSAGDEIQTEYFVERSNAAGALRAVKALGERILPHLIITELRTVAADELWMSGAYERDTLAIHFTFKNEPDAIAALTPVIEAALADFDARPHWGKVNSVSGESLARLYPRIDEFRALITAADPEGKFRNAALDRTVFGA